MILKHKIITIGTCVGAIVGFLIGFLSGLHLDLTIGAFSYFGSYGFRIATVPSGVFLGTIIGAIVSAIINNFIRTRKTPKDIRPYRNIIIIGIILGIIFIPWWLYTIPWWAFTLGNVPLYGISWINIILILPVVFSIGFIVYGIRMTSKQKKKITEAEGRKEAFEESS